MAQESLWDAGPVMQRGTILQGAYRYTLWRIWDEQLPRLLFILLIPRLPMGNAMIQQFVGASGLRVEPIVAHWGSLICLLTEQHSQCSSSRPTILWAKKIMDIF